MKSLLVLCAALLVFGGLPSPAASTAEAADSLAAEVTKDVEKTLDLWRDGRYEEVYGRVIVTGNHSKEYVMSHLAAAPRRPSCCWEKLQEARVTAVDPDQAILHGKFGFDTGAGNESVTRTLKLLKEDGIWKVKLSDVLSLSGKGKKVRGGKKK